MEGPKNGERALQWHPAFYASLRIELKNEADNLIFENEHQLGTKPFEIDVLIIKKESQKPVQKNFGRIFRKYNIIEYKSPDDYLSVDDFYKVYGYCCFYKADTEKTDAVRARLPDQGGRERHLLRHRRYDSHTDHSDEGIVFPGKSVAEKSD